MNELVEVMLVIGCIVLVILSAVVALIFGTIKLIKNVILESIDRATEEDPESDKE